MPRPRLTLRHIGTSETNPVAVAPYDYLSAAELDAAPLRLAISPLPTAFTLTRDALQGGRRGTPAVWRKSVLSTLRASDVATFGPLSDPETIGWPTLLDEVHASRETMDDALERLAATPGSAVLEALESDRDVTPTPAWDPVRRDPDRWMIGYVDALHRGWRGLEPLWSRSTALLEREAERVQAALDRGVSHAQIASELMPRASLVGSTLRVTTKSEPRRLRVDRHGLILTPLVSGPDVSTMASPGDCVVRTGYPLPDAWRVFDDRAPPPASLEALLGTQRTALLKRLDYPKVAGQLAEALNLKPSAISFHLRALESAGLIARERCGRNIIVHRTTRGTRLLAFYAVP